MKCWTPRRGLGGHQLSQEIGRLKFEDNHFRYENLSNSIYNFIICLHNMFYTGVKTFTQNLPKLNNKINILSVALISIGAFQISSSDSRCAHTNTHTHVLLPSLMLLSPFSPSQAGWTWLSPDCADLHRSQPLNPRSHSIFRYFLLCKTKTILVIVIRDHWHE